MTHKDIGREKMNYKIIIDIGENTHDDATFYMETLLEALLASENVFPPPKPDLEPFLVDGDDITYSLVGENGYTLTGSPQAMLKKIKEIYKEDEDGE